MAQYALTNGTTIVASAGNDHVRVATGGKVVSHGFLTTPGDDHVDPFGLYTSPGGVPGYVNVAATGRVAPPLPPLRRRPPCPRLDPPDRPRGSPGPFTAHLFGHAGIPAGVPRTSRLGSFRRLQAPASPAPGP